jgi:hypothetical protein
MGGQPRWRVGHLQGFNPEHAGCGEGRLAGPVARTPLKIRGVRELKLVLLAVSKMDLPVTLRADLKKSGAV